MPVTTRWSRSSVCSGRGVASRSARSAGGSGHASGPSPSSASSAASASGVSSLTQARWRVPNSRTRSSRSSGRRKSTRDVLSRSDARLSKSWIRPALIRCSSSTSGPRDGDWTSSISSLPRRRAPLKTAPSMAENGGSNVFSALIPGVSADSIRSPGSASASRRATISISGSSGIPKTVPWRVMDPWVQEAAAEIGRRAPRELEGLGGISSPPRAVHRAEECAAVCAALLPDEAAIERIPCSSPDHAPDLVAHLRGTGSRKVLLLGHIDTVVAHGDHRPLTREGDKLVGSGSVDMKGGVVLSIGVMRALVRRPDAYAEVALLVVCDEEWRTGSIAHVDRFADYDACLCFEGGDQTRDGHDGVVVRRKAAGTVLVTAHGRAAHSGSAPDRGRNALLALATAAQAVAGRHDPAGEQRLTAVPTVVRSGEAFNVVPGTGELFCDCRGDELDAIESVLESVPGDVGGVTLTAELIRRWPGMHSEE